MYQFSRSLYRELGPLVVSDRYGTACNNRQHFLESCENAFQRLASDRHYFARPSRTLFNDVRFFFPIAEQIRVFRVIDKYMRVAAHFVDEREREGSRSTAARCVATRARARGRRASASRCRAASTARRTSISRRASPLRRRPEEDGRWAGKRGGGRGKPPPPTAIRDLLRPNRGQLLALLQA